MGVKEGEQFHDGMMLSVVSEREDTVAFVESVLLLSVSYEKKHRSTDSEDRTLVTSQDEK